MIPRAQVKSAESVLIERARQLAGESTPDRSNETVEVLICGLRNESFAVELSALSSIQRSTGLTRVPCTPASVAGILNVRGELLTVLDLSAALGGQPLSDETTQVVLVETPLGRVGLLVDEVERVDRIALDRLDPPLSGATYSRGVADGRVVLLDLEKLLSGQNFEDVNQES